MNPNKPNLVKALIGFGIIYLLSLVLGPTAMGDDLIMYFALFYWVLFMLAPLIYGIFCGYAANTKRAVIGILLWTILVYTHPLVLRLLFAWNIGTDFLFALFVCVVGAVGYLIGLAILYFEKQRQGK